MMHALDYRVCAVLTLFFCVAIAWSCICRLGLGSTDVLVRVRIKYSLLLVGSLAFGGQPVLFNEWPGVAGVLFSASVFVSMLAGMHRWKGAAPEEVLVPDSVKRA